MLTFDTLLVKELQKQQSRAEFCDIVLQSRGVSVPVHSCVLSAFSPWLCGALSAMPSPRNGQKRLIEVQAVESCTLLSLVSLLYSGQFKDDKEEVLSAACKLGINIPHREAKRSSNEQNTQTENTVVEKECQTEALPIETACPSLWRRDQGFCTDITLAALQTVQGNPESMPSFQVMDVVPESAMYPTVSGPACLPQVYVCPPAASYQQPATQVASLPQPSSSTHAEPLASQGESAVGFSGGEDCVLEAFTRFENNIPGFINYFLDANNSGQREQSQRGEIKREGRARRARRRGVSGGFALKAEKFSVSKRQQNTNRCGRVARLALTGQGGGRVGGMLVNRQMFKNQGRRTRGAMKQEGERGRSSSRARQRRTGSRPVEPERQDAAAAPRRRGRPRKHPLPQSDDSRNLQPVQKTVNPPAPSLIHTAALPAANQTMDWLIDDVIAQLPLMPSNQHGITNSADSNPDQLKTQSTVKLTDFGIVHPQSEGELTDILDSFLRTFEHHVGACDSDVQDAATPSVSDGQSTSYAHATSVNATTQKAKNRPRATRRPQKPTTYWQLAGLKMKKSPRQQDEEMPARMTRSQSQKRKLEVIEELLRTDPAKQKKQKKDRSVSVPKETERPMKKCKSSTFDHSGNKVKSSKSSDQSELSSPVKKKHAKKKKPLPQRSLIKIACMNSQPKQPVDKNKTTGTRPALSAFDLVKQILENQQKREKEHKEHRIWTVKKQKGKDRLHACGADSKEKDDGMRVKRQKQETRERRKEAGDQKTTCLQRPSDKERSVSDGERLMENSFRSETPDSAFQRRVLKNTTDVPLVSAASHEKRSDTSDEDVDVVEVSSCLSEPSAVLPLSEIELSTDKEDSEEDQEIDVISVGSV